ncbi:MAG TPA: hypothetical protein VMR74_03940 [Gammaproteobacteria bacterium]|nr:hypothetical protein [Gammaproteobacteria bacterium]
MSSKRILIAVVALAAAGAAIAQDASDGPEPAAPVESAAPSAPRPAAGPRPVAVDQLDLGTTSITGNQELPKVLYIVPWKRSDLGDLVGRPVNSLLDEVLAPVDRSVFERHLSYYETLHGDSQEE